MDSTQGIFGFITERMQWLTQRQRVLAENVANADTPNFKARDLLAPNFSDELRLAMVTPRMTQPNHIATASNLSGGAQLVKTKTDETSISGNGVDVETEMMKVSSTMMDYQTMTALLKKWQGMLRTAIGRGA